MSQMKWLPVILITTLLVSPTQAEPNRTFYSLENQLPRWEQLELGTNFETYERAIGPQEITYSEVSVYARYGLLDNLAVTFEVPAVNIDADPGETETGLGDVELGFQLRAYEDIFGYPYVVPYVNISFPTGDEDKGLGDGEVNFVGGISYGSRINDWIDWVLDVSYNVNSDEENQLRVGHSYVWNLSDDFAILTEVAYREVQQLTFGGDDDEYLLAGGFNYNWTRDLEMGVSVAVGSGQTDVEVKARLSYSF